MDATFSVGDDQEDVKRASQTKAQKVEAVAPSEHEEEVASAGKGQTEAMAESPPAESPPAESSPAESSPASKGKVASGKSSPTRSSLTKSSRRNNSLDLLYQNIK